MNKVKKIKKIALTGGGTAGHIWPTLLVAQELKKLSAQTKFIYLGSRAGMESKIVPGRGIDYFGISTGKIRRYWSFQNLLTPFLVMIGFFQSLLILAREKPEIIYAKGGYVTVPPVIAGWFLRIPAIIHESDSVLGLSNRILSLFAKKIATAYPIRYYPTRLQKKIVYVGLPVRKELITAEKNQGYQIFSLSNKLPVLLVFGGSQGAHKINQLIFKKLSKILNKTQIIHLTGSLDYDKAIARRKSLKSHLKDRYLIFDFLVKEMPYAEKMADLIVARCGANTLTEIAAVGKASILIPLLTSAANHQVTNAAIFRENKAAQVLFENEITAALLAKKIIDLVSRPFLLKQLGENAAKLFKPDAAQNLAKLLLNL